MWFVLTACQAPFGTDRHDLVGFRVAAMSASPTSPGNTVVPRVAVIADDHPWSDQRVDLRWYWVASPDDVEGLDPTAIPDAQGPEPLLTLPSDRPTLALVALHLDQIQRAYLTIASPPSTFSGPTDLSLATVDLTVRDVLGTDLALDARLALEATPAETVPVGGFGRFTAAVSGDPLVRWMATRGTFFELDRHSADWAAGDLILDGEDISDGRTELDPGPVTVLALALGESGETGFRATDLYVGDEPPGLWVKGRFVPTDAAVAWQPGDAVRGTLTADDGSPTGLVLTGATVEASVADWGTEALACSEPLQGPFDPGWLLTGICPRSAVDGVQVVVVPEVSR